MIASLSQGSHPVQHWGVTNVLVQSQLICGSAQGRLLHGRSLPWHGGSANWSQQPLRDQSQHRTI